jgi:hypothetical protein
MNNILVTLGTNDALDIKQYVKYARLLESVELSKRNLDIEAFTEHGSPDSEMRHLQGVLRSFDVLDDGKGIKWCDPDPSPFSRLPHAAMCLIKTYASTSNTGVVIDLDSKTVSGLETGLRGVNKRLDYDSHRFTHWEYNDVTINITTRNSTMGFNGLAPLRQLNTFTLSGALFRSRRSGRTLSSTEIVLRIRAL